ncbi:hypothetical protein GCM10008023_19690 [Sphingomonas glacialis]|uniref:XRE family transcriptional regulator n=1 Tax=Sphingomonas glacialis TaxID=658225 RepID=A0ABQ3LRK5_9SPHN|nr:hypothetical protein [Sphingomonas glacialis]GHH16085.1 hypothetical protein GCM10008023_19690 [Sphingomonas glacialis]
MAYPENTVQIRSASASVSDGIFAKTAFARDLIRLRFRRLRLSQSAFADRFGLTFGLMKDQEQARVAPSRALRVLIAAIELDPELIERAARVAAERWSADVPQ